MGSKSSRAVLGFITRSSTTAVVAGGALTLGSIAVATAGAPVAVTGLGLAGLAFLPPTVEWGANRVTDFFSGLLQELASGREPAGDSAFSATYRIHEIKSRWPT